MRVQWTLGDLKSIGGGQIVQIIILRRPERQLVCVGPGPARHRLMHTTLAHTSDHFSFLKSLNRDANKCITLRGNETTLFYLLVQMSEQKSSIHLYKSKLWPYYP